MPIIQSAIKRVRQEKTRSIRNAITKRKYKDLMKNFTKLVDAGSIKEAQELYPSVQKAIDMAAKKNIIAKNNAGHKKSRLAKMLHPDRQNKSEEAKPSTTKKKTAPKKTTSKAKKRPASTEKKANSATAKKD